MSLGKSRERSATKAKVHVSLDDLIRLQFEAKEFSLLPRKPVGSLLSGRHGSRLRGRGLTFEELRRYRPGDDIRSIDWRATARLSAAQVRVYSEERDRPVLLIVDQRTSMFFGSARTTKATLAAEAAALTAWGMLEKGDRVGAILFGDREIVEIKPRRSRANVMRICHELVRLNAALVATDQQDNCRQLNDALGRAVNVASHDHLVVMVTDYSGDDEGTCKLTTRLATHNDVLAVLIYDPLGARLPVHGQMRATDGKRQFAVPESLGFQSRFETAFRQRSAELRERLQAIRIPILPLCTHEPVVEQVVSALRWRK